jgi:hypothetical protein
MTNPISAAVDALKTALGIGGPQIKTNTGFKAFGNTWFAWWSNNFEDRDGELFSEKAIDEYVRRVDVGAVPPPELWLWHTPGTRIGAAEWVGRIGHFACAAGKFDATDAGIAAQQHFGKSADNGMSHGFYYETDQKSDDGIYHQFNTFEISVLPREKAANPYTAFEEVFDMEMSDEKRQWLAQVLGDSELTDRLITATEERSKAMEALDVRYKDLVQMDAPAPADEPVVEAEAAKDDMPMEAAPAEDSAPAPADLGSFVESITEDVAVLANAVNGLIGKLDSVMQSGAAEKAKREDEIAALRAEVKSLREAIDLRPRSATTDTATEIQNSALTAEFKQQLMKRDPFWGTQTQE